MAVGTANGSDLQLDQLLQAVAGQLGDQVSGATASQSRGQATAAPWALGMVCPVEGILKPGKRTCPAGICGPPRAVP